jgi:ABC-type uncharacterized transport system substrate-binding protein
MERNPGQLCTRGDPISRLFRKLASLPSWAQAGIMAAAYQGQRMNNRRKLIIALGAGALVAPLGSFGQQQGNVWRVGILSARRRPASLDLDYYGAFPLRMSELGYVEGRNLIIEWRFADGEHERLPGMAAELVKLKPDVILALGPPGAVAAQKAGIKVLPVTAQTPQEIETAFSTMIRENAGAVIVALDPFFVQQVPQIAAQASKHRLPSIFANREYAETGGLMSYGQNQVDLYRQAAGYVDRIFKGGKPGDLPVEQPTKLEIADQQEDRGDAGSHHSAVARDKRRQGNRVTT